jgi:hypothetical protein
MPLQRAADIARSLPRRHLPDTSPTGGCFASGAVPRVNPATGNLTVQVGTPAGGGYDPVPVLTYSTLTGGLTEFGAGWTGLYRQEVDEIDADTVDLYKGNGAARRYSDRDENGYYAPPDGTANALRKNEDGTWTETQVNGFRLHYDATGSIVKT